MLDAIPESEATPYLYYVLAWPWARLFGFGEVGLRSLSALVGAAIVPVAYGAGAALVSRRRGSSRPRSSASILSSSGTRRRLVRTASSRSSPRARLLFFGRALRAGRPAGPFWAGRSRPRSRSRRTTSRSSSSCRGRVAARPVAGSAARGSRLAPSGGGPRSHTCRSLLDQRGAGEAVTEASLALESRRSPEGPGRRIQLPGGDRGQRPRRRAARRRARPALRPLTRRSSDGARSCRAAWRASSILAPVALALGGADYVIVRNTILAIVPAAICVAAGYAANRLGLAAAAALCVLLLGDHALRLPRPALRAHRLARRCGAPGIA